MRPSEATADVDVTAADGQAGGGRLARLTASPRFPVVAWSVLAVYLGLVQFFVRSGSWGALARLDVFSARAAFGGWLGRDSTEYLSIATDGYLQRQLVYFPVYPILINVVDVLPGGKELAAVLVTMAGGMVGAVAMWRWMPHVGVTGRARVLGLLSLLLYPYSIFLYGIAYPNAMFIALTIVAFLLLERGRLGWATLVGIAATAARPSGFAVAIGMFVVVLERDGVFSTGPRAWPWVRALHLPTRVHRERLRWRHLLPLCSLSGLFAYMAYQWIEWGSPTRWFTEQSNYHDPGWRSLLKVQYFDAWVQGFEGTHLATTTAQALLLAAVLLSIPAVGRKLGWGYGVYVLCVAALPASGVATFMGVGRYLISAFPVYALLGTWLAPRERTARVAVAAAVVVLGVMAAGFAEGVYLT
jgi:hypothetical protein